MFIISLQLLNPSPSFKSTCYKKSTGYRYCSTQEPVSLLTCTHAEHSCIAQTFQSSAFTPGLGAG